MWSIRCSEKFRIICRKRSSHRRWSVRKGVLRNFAKFTGKYLCRSLLFNNRPQCTILLRKETLAQVFSCEFCEISKHTFLQNTSKQRLLQEKTRALEFLLVSCRLHEYNFRKQPPEVFYLKAVHKNFTIFTEKHRMLLTFTKKRL